MMSTKRFLLRRLAVPPSIRTLSTIGRRQHHLRSREVGWTSSGSVNNYRSITAPTPAAVHLPTASFWSWMTGDSKKEEATPEKSRPETQKKEEDQLPISQIVPAGSEDVSDILSADSDEGRKEKSEEGDGVPPENLSSKIIDPSKDVEEKNDDMPTDGILGKSADSPNALEAKANGISPEESPATKATDAIECPNEKEAPTNDAAESTVATSENADDGPSEEESPKDLTGVMAKKADNVAPEEISAESTIYNEVLEKKTDGVLTEDIPTTTIDSTSGEGANDIPPGKASPVTELTELLAEKDGGGSSDRRGFASLFQADTQGAKVEALSKKTSGSKSDRQAKTPISPEKIVRSGRIKWIDYPKKVGVIIQDKKFQKVGPIKRNDVMFSFYEIQPEIKQFVQRHDAELFKPAINMDQRLRFQVRVHDNKDGEQSLRAFNVKYEPPFKSETSVNSKGGIPLFQWKEALSITRRTKANLGKDIYNILAAQKAPKEEKMKKIHNALDQCNKKMEWTRDQAVSERLLAAGCKTRLGEQIYDMLSNIATVDNVEQKADEAYFHCLKELSELNIPLAPNQEEELKRWAARRKIV